MDTAYQRVAEFSWLRGEMAKREAKRGGQPERRVKDAFKRATTAATKLAEIVNGDDVEAFTPEHMRGLREALQPVLRWLDGLERTSSVGSPTSPVKVIEAAPHPANWDAGLSEPTSINPSSNLR